jgi:SAM-dependent methyltransferase
MRWDFGPANPADPFTRLSCYKWLVARSLSRTIASASRHASGRLLDVGGGDKRFAPYFVSYTDRYISLDHPSTFYGNPRNVDVYGTALDLPFCDDCFETVASFEVLEHVPDSRRMLLELHRVLKPGGVLILTAPFLWGEHCQPHDYLRFTVQGLNQLITEAGFQVKEQKRTNSFWAFFGQRFCYYLEPVFGRRLRWMHISLSFMVLACASLLEQLHQVDSEYSMSLVVAVKCGNDSEGECRACSADHQSNE